MDKEIDKLTAELQKLRDELEQTQSQQSEDTRNISKQQKSTERFHAKRQILQDRKEECNRSIRDLGVLPEEAFNKYTKTNTDKVRIHAAKYSFSYLRRLHSW
jgi:structural maintenance of chromosome 3 (chondroitin sulfate proteoglycan 6)